MSPRLPTGARPPARERNGGTILALGMVLAVAAGLLAMVSMVLPQARGLVLVLAGFGGFVTLHYFTWGHWLTRITQEERSKPHGDDAT